MQSYEDILCILYILQIITGAFGNFLFLCLCGCNLMISQRIRPLVLIFINLSFSHIMIILFQGIPFAIEACMKTVFICDTECKILIYLRRVARGLSLCTSCLLSVYQTKNISSGNSKWIGIKCRAPKCIFQSCVFMWVLNLLTDITVPLYVTGPRNYTNNMLSSNLVICSIDRYAMANSKLIIWKSLNDALFVGLMSITSGYMVVVLCRHHWQVQHIHNTSLNPGSSPEIRATKVILLLMSIFACFYSVSSIFVIVMNNSKFISQRVIHLAVLFNLCYPIISPFVFISGDSQMLSCCNTFKRIKKSYPHS